MKASDAVLPADDLTNVLIGVLRGTPDARWRSAPVNALTACAFDHGVLPLLAQRIAREPAAPAPLRAALMTETTRAVAVEAVRHQELTALLDAWGRRGCGALLMKGAALAYGYYPRPDLRPRTDTDVLVSLAERHAAEDVLRERGYDEVQQVEASLVMYQLSFRKSVDGVPVHLVDLHWRIANPQPFGDVLRYGELEMDATPIPALGQAARGLSPVHALILACVHRVAHHADLDRLVWLYDIGLIAARLGPADWASFRRLAVERQVAPVCGHSLRLAVARLGASVPDDILNDAAFADEAASPAMASYFVPGRAHIHDVLLDLRALPAWRSRLSLIRQHVFPSPKYMRERYAPESGIPLPALYMVRALRGARKWLTRG